MNGEWLAAEGSARPDLRRSGSIPSDSMLYADQFRYRMEAGGALNDCTGGGGGMAGTAVGSAGAAPPGGQQIGEELTTAGGATVRLQNG
jgi:hypothetical protein